MPTIVRDGWARAGLEPPPDLRAFQGDHGGPHHGAFPPAPAAATDELTDGGIGVDAGAGFDAGSDVDLEAGARGGGRASSRAHRLAHDMGLAHERALDASARSAGAHYTPADVALGLTRLVLGGGADRSATPPTVWDPACGGGAFLLAAAEVLFAQGHDPDEIVSDLLWGTDTDAGAVAVAEAALVLWATLRGAPGARPGDHLSVADALRSDPPLGCGFGHVLANPPFQGQLAGGSVRTRSARAELKQRWGGVVGPYTDTSTLFLVAATGALAPGGRLGMILPTSVLSARDAQQARDHVDAVADLVGLWVATEPVFLADVEVCAPVLVRRVPPAKGSDRPVEPVRSAEAVGAAEPVMRWRLRSFEPLPATARDGRRWSDLALTALDVPSPSYRSSCRMGTVAHASSGFRDEYYGLAGHVHDLSDLAVTLHAHGLLTDGRPGKGWPDGLRPLVTSGTIDPGRCLWGRTPVRFAKHTYARPVVDEVALVAAAGEVGGPTARAAAWAAATACPKVVVATQTRVGEAAVDEIGSWLPSTPTIVVRLAAPTVSTVVGGDDTGAVPGEDEVDRLWALAAVICSPVGTVAALAGSFGSARSTHAIKPSAASVLDLPLPVDRTAWSRGASALRNHERDLFATAMAQAYGIDTDAAAELTAWWSGRVRW